MVSHLPMMRNAVWKCEGFAAVGYFWLTVASNSPVILLGGQNHTRESRARVHFMYIHTNSRIFHFI